jgi:hypothetical protein
MSDFLCVTARLNCPRDSTFELSMSALGHSRRFERGDPMSASPSKEDIPTAACNRSDLAVRQP